MRDARDDTPQPPAPGRLDALRALVAAKFPAQPLPAASRFRTGRAALDLHGGLRQGALTEACGTPGAGSLLLAALLEAAARDSFLVGLIDAAGSFEPEDWPEAQLRRLLWVMGRDVPSSLKAADLLLRDGNLPILVLDLQMLPPRALRRIPAGTWHRFHKVIEPLATVLLVLTPRPLVEGAAARIALGLKTDLDALHRPRAALAEQWEARIFERGAAPAPPESTRRTA